MSNRGQAKEHRRNTTVACSLNQEDLAERQGRWLCEVCANLATLLLHVRRIGHCDLKRVRFNLRGDASRTAQMVAKVDHEFGPYSD